MPRLLLFLPLLLALSACVSAESWEAVRLLKDIEAQGGPSELKSATPAPVRQSLTYAVEGRARLADLYRPNQPLGGGLVLVPGFTELGKSDPRLVALAGSLARARFLVLVPELAGSKELRLRLEDARAIADATVFLADHPDLAGGTRAVGVVAISYAVGLAVLASLEPDAGDALGFLLGLGGYYDSAAVVRFITTGRYREGAAWRRGRPHQAAKWIFLASHAETLEDAGDRQRLTEIAERRLANPQAAVAELSAGLGPEGRALFDLLTNQDPARVAALLAELPQGAQARLRKLSLRRYDLSHLTGKLILIHGREDPMVPYSESLALSGAVPGSDLHLIEGFSHIDPKGLGLQGRLQLIDAVQALLAQRRP